MLNHRVSVRVMQSDGVQTEVLKAGERKLRRRLLNFLLGNEMNVLVISPGKTVSAVEISEIPAKGGERCAAAS